MTEQKLLPIDHCRHLAFAAIGGFFGGYALLCRGGILGSSQTMNLLELVSDALFGRGSSVLLHLLCLVIYVVGVMFSVIVPHVFHVDMRRLSPCITAAAAIAMGFFPADMTPLVALYPVFFSMSIQWSTFAGARGFQSATIFNSNNTKQVSLALAHYLCEGEREQLTKLWFYGSTLLAFHAGAVWSWLAVKWLDYLYSEEGSRTINYGKEGVTYEMVDGKPVYTDLIKNNVDGIPPRDMIISKTFHDGMGLVDYRRFWQISNTSRLEAIQVWQSNNDYAWVMPSVSLTVDEGNLKNDIYPDIATLVEEKTVRYIMGTESMDTYDAFVAQIEKMGIQKVIDVYQAALTRYNAR